VSEYEQRTLPLRPTLQRGPSAKAELLVYVKLSKNVMGKCVIKLIVEFVLKICDKNDVEKLIVCIFCVYGLGRFVLLTILLLS